MRAVRFGFMAVAVAIALYAVRTAHATSPYTVIPDDYAENMENDTDTWTPSDTDPINDPDAGGDTPGAQGADPGTPYGSAGFDWYDLRNGGSGLIEEVPNAAFAGAPTAPDGSAHVAIVQMDSGDGPFGRQNRDRFNGPTTGPAPIGDYWATIDLYIDPALAYGGPDGIPDVWWTNAVNRSDTNSYMSESGMTMTVDPSGLTWSIATTTGAPLAVVPVGTWIGMEVQPILRVGDGGVDFEHRVYSDGGTHSVLIGSFTSAAAFTGAGDYAFLAGPRYNWFAFPQANITHLWADNIGWAGPQEVPEPSTIVLAGLGALGLAFAARRRRAKA